MIAIKRIYDGIEREAAAIDLWAKAIAPSGELRQWYNHAPERWAEFRLRYAQELAVHEAKDELARLRRVAAAQTVTLLTATRHETESHATVLRDLLSK